MWFFFDDFDGRNECGTRRRGESRAEDKTPRRVFQKINQVPGAGGESTDSAQAFAEGSHDDVDAAVKSEVFRGNSGV